MRMLVTGAAGMLGRDVVAAAVARGHEVTGLSRAELDITDPGAVERAIGEAGPAVVVNCAAWTDVDGAESCESGALAVNGTAAGTLAGRATAGGARLVHVSSDYVFDGSATAPYLESDPVGPVSAYGRTKLAGEEAVLAAAGDHAVVRSSWLFGAGGRNFVATMLALADGGREEVSVVIDQVGCPTYTGHLAPALVTVAERGTGGVHHIAAAGRCSWHELAVETFGRAGLAMRVLVATSAEMARPARRPAWSVLGSERADPVVLPAWQDGVAAYLDEVGRLEGRAGGVEGEVERR
ncbi:MAG: dTDP-4-dehydrorhamnose reductase [Solirubrobacteraceae bacterium]|jgi:dTDP-4-dehydrorhamnose reductase|nr:dTDP-4-dehydrorhamnose reductase [Solirubrobacteraceae bacterium]